MSKNWFHIAGDVWTRLTSAAVTREILTYEQIKTLAQTNAHNVGYALGPIQAYCKETRYPPLTAIVVNSTTRVPGTGFDAWDIDDLETAEEKVFAFNWSAVDNPFSGFGPQDTPETFAHQLSENPASAEEVYRKVKSRGLGQQIFRDALLLAYDGQCAMCGLTYDEALQGAHIVAWAEASHAERLDVRNGVLLCSLHHSLFDHGYLTVDLKYRIHFHDPTMEDGDYSVTDELSAVKLHGRPLRLPRDKGNAPAPSHLSRHHAKHEFDLAEVLPTD